MTHEREVQYTNQTDDECAHCGEWVTGRMWVVVERCDDGCINDWDPTEYVCDGCAEEVDECPIVHA